MEKLNKIAWWGHLFNCCELGGRVMAVGSDGGKIKLTELIPGETVQEKVVETNIEARWEGDPVYYSVLPHKGLILLLGQSEDRKSVVSCLIDPFAGLDDGTGEIGKGNVSVEWLDVEIGGFVYWWNSELIRVGNRIIFSYQGGDPLWELEVDEVGHRLTGRELGIKVGHGRWACYQPISDHETIVIGGGYPGTNEVSLVDMGSETIQELPPLPYKGCMMSSTFLFNRFVLVVGGSNFGSCIPELSIFDIKTRKWSVIKRSGDWWGGKCCPFLSLTNGNVYVIRDLGASCAYRISLASLVSLIVDPDIQSEFSLAVDTAGLPPIREGVLTYLTQRSGRLNTRSTSLSSITPLLNSHCINLITRKHTRLTRSLSSLSTIPSRLTSISTSIESRREAVDRLTNERKELSHHLSQVRTRLISQMDSLLPTHPDMIIIPIPSLPLHPLPISGEVERLRAVLGGRIGGRGIPVPVDSLDVVMEPPTKQDGGGYCGMIQMTHPPPSIHGAPTTIPVDHQSQGEGVHPHLPVRDQWRPLPDHQGVPLPVQQPEEGTYRGGAACHHEQV